MKNLIYPFALLLPGIALGILSGHLLTTTQHKTIGLVAVVLMTGGWIALAFYSYNLTAKQKAIGMTVLACLNFSLAGYWLVLALQGKNIITHLAFVTILTIAGGFAVYYAKFLWWLGQGDKK